jgi:hypothetical protein
MNPIIMEQVQEAIYTGSVPDVQWQHGDDLCNCTFQRIGFWTNPYIGKTLLVRFCCIWDNFHKQYPEYVQEVEYSYDYNKDEYVMEPMDWDSDHDMPRALWYRQLATKTGLSLDEVRAQYADQEPPKATR